MPDPEAAYRHAVAEAEEVGLRLDAWQPSRAQDPDRPWVAVAQWSEERAAWQRWLAGDPDDDLCEPPEPREFWARGKTRAEAAWRAIERACDG